MANLASTGFVGEDGMRDGRRQERRQSIKPRDISPQSRLRLNPCFGVAYIAHLSYRLAASFANCQHCRVGWIKIT